MPSRTLVLPKLDLGEKQSRDSNSLSPPLGSPVVSDFITYNVSSQTTFQRASEGNSFSHKKQKDEQSETSRDITSTTVPWLLSSRTLLSTPLPLWPYGRFWHDPLDIYNLSDSSPFSKLPPDPSSFVGLADTWGTLTKESRTLPCPAAWLLGSTAGAERSSYKIITTMPMDVTTFSWPPTHTLPLILKQYAHLFLLGFLSPVWQ